MPLAASHLHLQPAGVALVIAAAVIYVAVAVALPTRKCPRCKGDRVQFTSRSLFARAHARPCKRCSGTGRVPRLGARAIHRLIWSATREKNK